jgi:hypothetical protein
MSAFAEHKAKAQAVALLNKPDGEHDSRQLSVLVEIGHSGFQVAYGPKD